jgi:hypothetical protein
VAHDNLKRLLLVLSPDLLPGWHGFHALERGWFRYTEWAADDDAMAGNPRLSLPLAEALVRIARMGGTPAPSSLNATFLTDGGDLSARVDRLLRSGTRAAIPQHTPVVAVAGILAVFVGATLQPLTLESAHRLLEQMIRLGL